MFARKKKEALDPLPIVYRKFEPEAEVARYHRYIRSQEGVKTAADRRFKELEDARWAGQR